MSRRSWSSHLPLWAAAAALALKAAVPVLAAVAAGIQGVPVAAVCDVYGVALPSADPHAGHHGHAGHQADGADPGDPSPHSGKHRGDHCALTGLSAMAGPDGAMPQAVVSATAPAPLQSIRCAAIHDACAAWAARLQHAPPPQRA